MPRDGAFGSEPRIPAPLFSSLPPAERALRNAFYLACTVLAGWMLWRALHPMRPFQIDRINKDMGLWSLRFLFACLALSPLSRWLKAPAAQGRRLQPAAKRRQGEAGEQEAQAPQAHVLVDAAVPDRPHQQGHGPVEPALPVRLPRPVAA